MDGQFRSAEFPFEAIEETLNDWGYVTEKLADQTFFQRRFASTGEQDQMIEQLIPSPTDHDRCAHSRCPIDMIFQG